MREEANRQDSGKPPPERGDAELADALARARAGDDEGFRTVYRSVHPGLLRYLRVLVGQDAEDVASEAWLQIVRDLSSFHGEADGFRGWVATVARHRALDHLRRVRRRPVAAGGVDELVDLPARDDTAGSAVEAVDTDAALALIASLPRDQAEAVMLRVVLGLDARSAAGVLGKRAGAVRMAAHRGLRALADRLERESAARPGRQDAPHPTATGEVTRTTASTLEDMR